MKKIILWSLSLLFSTTTWAEKAVPSDIDGITVYRKGAEINRTARATIPAGISTVVFEELSDKINASTIQVRSGKGVLILSVNFGKDHLKKKHGSKRYQQLKDSLDLITEDFKQIQNERAVLVSELKILDENRKIGGANTGVKTAELQQMLAFYGAQSRKLREKDRKAQNKETEIRNVKDRLQRQLNDITKKLNRPYGKVEVMVIADKAVTTSFELSYLVPDAGWSPLYDLRAKDVKSEVGITYKANVWQNSGIDWVKADLTVSTGNPTVSNTAPVMSTWFIDFMNVSKPYGLMQYEKANARGAATYGFTSGDGIADNISLGSHTTVTEGQLNTFFEIDIPYTIPSDRKAHMVAMKDWKLPATYNYYAVPRLDRDAFLLAKVTDWEKLSLLPGTANIFFEGAYVGTTHLDPRSTQTDTLSFSLGRDRKVVIKREKLIDLCVTRAIGANKKETVAYDISIRNNKREAITIDLMDQIPVTKNKDITVTLEESTGAKYNAERGKLEWKIGLNPGERKVVRLKFSVKYPKDKAIPNL